MVEQAITIGKNVYSCYYPTWDIKC